MDNFNNFPLEKYMMQLPDMVSLIIEEPNTRKLVVRDLLTRIMHKPDRRWFDLCTPLEVNGVFLGNGGFIITLFTFWDIDKEKCCFDTLERLYTHVQTAIQEQMNHFCISYTVEIDGLIASIATFPRSNEESIRTIGSSLVDGIRSHCQTALEVLSSEYGIMLKMYNGNPTYGIESLSDAYEKVYNFWKFDEFIGDTLPQRCTETYAPQHTQELIPLAYIRQLSNQMVRLIGSDQFQQAPEIFSDFLDELVGMEPRMLPIVRSRLLVFITSFADKLLGTGVLTENDVPVAQMINEIHRAANYAELKTSLSTCLNQMVAVRVCRQKVNADSQIRRIKAYIAENYSDPNLSAQSISEIFGINASYLSTLFKAHADTRLVDYIHEVRINHAISLLENTNQSVDQICKNVGYGSSSTFFRAFKKYRGTTPSAYR